MLAFLVMSLGWPMPALAAADSHATPAPTAPTPDSPATPSPSPTANPTRTPTPTATPLASRTSDPTSAPSPTRTPTPAPTPTRTRTPTPTPTATPTVTPSPTPSAAPVPTGVAKPTPAPTQAPSCAPSSPNLVLNPSFESVSGPPGSNGEWPVFEPLLGAGSGVSTTQVPGWTRSDTGSLWPRAVSNGSPWAPTRLAALGSTYLLIPPRGAQGVVGTLSTPTSPGVTYLLSAHIATMDVGNAPTFALRLRNSATGAESAAVVQEPESNWALVTGTVPGGTGFDQVVQRYHASMTSGADWGLVDDIRVCRAAALAPTGHPTSWWSFSRVVGVSALAAVLTGVLVAGAAVVRTRRRRRL